MTITRAAGTANRVQRLAVFLVFGFLPIFSTLNALAGERIWVPVRWCGVEGAPSMVNPGLVGESTTDDVLWRRHERPTDAIYQGTVQMTFRAGSTAAIKNGPLSFPIIRDPLGSGGDLIGETETTDAVIMCRRAWLMGDPLYFDQNNNSVVDSGTDTLLSASPVMAGFVDLGHSGAPLHAVPGDVGFVDGNSNGTLEIGERVYRDENTNGMVDGGDTLLVNTLGTVVGSINAADAGASLLPAPGRLKYLDLIRQPANAFNIGYPAVQGITAVSANDVEFPSIAFPVHGVAQPDIGGLGVVMDDPSQYLPPGPDFTLFETQLVAHEFGHAFTLEHGDGIDDDMDGFLDDADDPTAPVPGAPPGTLCDSNNVMSYCWLDNGTSGNPNLTFIGVGTPTFGILTTAQADKVRDFVLTNTSDRIVDPVTAPLVSSRVDVIGEIDPPFEHIDIADLSLRIDASRVNTILSLTTRRPFPSNASQTVDFHFLLDVDEDSNTGGAPNATAALTDFTGAEYLSSVRFLGLEVEEVSFLEFDPVSEDFLPGPLDRIQVIRETVRAIPDFPFDPERERSDVPIKELISVIVPSDLLTVPLATSFRVEYISHDLESNVVDRARSPGMDFRLPIFPVCSVEPEIAPQGGSTTVRASGLLPNREVHLFLGDTEVGTGNSDDVGEVVLSMQIPPDARVGERLVTVGALAVSADCSVTVVPRGQETFFIRGDCNDDGEVDISDPIADFTAQFLGQTEILCEDACDSNDDGASDVSDPITTLSHLFLGDPAVLLPPGTKHCGVDPTEDELGCEETEHCP